MLFPPRERQMKKKPAQKAKKKQHVNDTTKTKVNQQQTNYTQETTLKTAHSDVHVIKLCRILFDVEHSKSYLGVKTFIIYLVIYIFWSNTNLYLKII